VWLFRSSVTRLRLLYVKYFIMVHSFQLEFHSSSNSGGGGDGSSSSSSSSSST
jgi:hypothetical protein